MVLPSTYNSEPEFKAQFARFLLQGYTPFVAALKIWPSDNGFAYNISEAWKNDPYVLSCMQAAKDEAEAKERPPTKEELIKDLRLRAHDMEDDDFIKAFRLIGEMIGAIEKPAATQVNVQQNTFDRVMIVKDHGTAQDWQEKLKLQQAKLVLDNG